MFWLSLTILLPLRLLGTLTSYTLAGYLVDLEARELHQD
jgi:hypothetical protein